jgi:hypothetical protein
VPGWHRSVAATTRITLFPETSVSWASSAPKWGVCGWHRYAAKARSGGSTGNAWTSWSTAGYHPRESVIHGLGTASTPEPEARAECGNPARSDLCGGPGAIPVPTATDLHHEIGELTVDLDLTRKRPKQLAAPINGSAARLRSNADLCAPGGSGRQGGEGGNHHFPEDGLRGLGHTRPP